MNCYSFGNEYSSVAYILKFRDKRKLKFFTIINRRKLSVPNNNRLLLPGNAASFSHLIF